MQRRPVRELMFFWLPLSANWIMMGLESPIVASFISRFPEQKSNLAAHGVAFSIGLFVEAPIVMMLTASNALVHGRENYLRLRNFNIFLCSILTIVMLILPVPSVWHMIAEAIALPPLQSERTRLAVAFLLPWPAAIGVRRFYHGLLINAGKTAAVAWGTLVRVLSMVLTVSLLAFSEVLPAYCIGTTAVSVGVITEMFYAWRLSRERVKSLLETNDPEKPLTATQMAQSYLPLALSSVIAFAITPIITLFLGRFPLPLESMAVHPLITNFVFLACCPALCLQEALITWLSQHPDDRQTLLKITRTTAIIGVSAILLVAHTPLRTLWFGGVAGLSDGLLKLIPLPLSILSLQAASNATQSWQRAHLILAKKSHRITQATAAEVFVIVATLATLLASSSVVGATAAALALVAGRLASLAVGKV